MLSVLIVSEVRLYREGLAELLARRGTLHVIGTAIHTADALTRACELEPAIVVLDYAAADSLSFSRALTQVRPDIRVVALGLPDSDDAVLAFAEAGIAGYVAREGSVDDVVAAIESAARGELRCSPQLAGTILRRLAWRAAVGGEMAPRSALTCRETEIVRLIDQGLSNKEIAVRLGIEVATVKNHVHNLLEKLRVHRRAEAAARLRGRDARLVNAGGSRSTPG
jgi:two-component system, NarL family, nitrate/nitrite response regulator NarL